jgi:hypothetical protein
MWVSGNQVKRLPGVVTVGVVTYTDTGTRTWKVNDNQDYNYVVLNANTSSGRVTLACYLTIGPDYWVWNNFDTIRMCYQYYCVLQQIKPDAGDPYIRAHSCGTPQVSPNITVVTGKTYWVNLGFDGANHTCSVAAFDPDNNFAQVGNTVSCPNPSSTISLDYIAFGRNDLHGDNPDCTTQTYFDNIMIDYTNPPFPLLPDIGEPPPPDTTPPSDIATVNDGTGNDIDSTSSTTQLSANWTAATDNESSITNYHYAIGDTPGSTGVLGWTTLGNVLTVTETGLIGWTTLGNVLTVTETGLTLTVGTTYYFSVKAQSAGGTCSATNSDGQCVLAGGPGGDETPPAIANVNAINITNTGATITWATDEPATSRVQYGI